MTDDRTETTLDQGRMTESNCVCMYTVQRRVIVDNKCEFQHSSSHGCTFDARLVSKAPKDHQNVSEIRLDDLRSPTHVKQKKEDTLTSCIVRLAKNSASLPTDSCLTNPVHQRGQLLSSIRHFNCSCTNTAKS